jgi:hypothetical protein
MNAKTPPPEGPLFGETRLEIGELSGTYIAFGWERVNPRLDIAMFLKGTQHNRPVELPSVSLKPRVTAL